MVIPPFTFARIPVIHFGAGKFKMLADIIGGIGSVLRIDWVKPELYQVDVLFCDEFVFREIRVRNKITDIKPPSYF